MSKQIPPLFTSIFIIVFVRIKRYRFKVYSLKLLESFHIFRLAVK